MIKTFTSHTELKAIDIFDCLLSDILFTTQQIEDMLDFLSAVETLILLETLFNSPQKVHFQALRFCEIARKKGVY